MSAEVEEALQSDNRALLHELLGANVTSLSAALSEPVSIERTALFAVENFGSSMAPLYIAIALFVGTLLIMVAVRPSLSRTVRQKVPGGDALKPSQEFLGHYGVVGLLALAQDLVMSLGCLLFLQVQAAHPWLFLLGMLVAGQVLAFLVYTLVQSFSNLGKALAVVLLVVQVTGCNGSYPLMLLPHFVQAVSPWLPATHVVALLRAAMFGVYGADYWVSLGALLAFVAPCLLLGLVLSRPLMGVMARFKAQVEETKLM